MEVALLGGADLELSPRKMGFPVSPHQSRVVVGYGLSPREQGFLD